MYDAAFYEVFEEEEKQLRKYLPGKKNYFITWKTIQESGHRTPVSGIISIRTQSIIPLGWADSLSAIITRSAGFDHVCDFVKKAGRRIKCAYLPDYASRAVAEHALMLIVALLRKLKIQNRSMATFHRDGLTGCEIHNRTIAIAGVGRIGGEIADIAHGLKMQIIGVDINPRHEIIEEYGVKYLGLEDALVKADVLVCSLPLTNLTCGLLNYAKLSLMPQGSVFVNVARGEISPSPDLLSLIDENHLAGIGIDVYDCEKDLASVLRDGKELGSLPPERRRSVEASLKLIGNEKVITTPHNAFNTVESVERKSVRTAENLAEFFIRGNFITPVPEFDIMN